MATPQEDKIKKKKAVIVDALKRCLQRDVYSRITVQDIADESGFSKGGVLHYFATKEDIYLDLIKDIFTKFVDAHSSILKWNLNLSEVAPLSALVGAESFILDRANIKIIINLLLYAFEEEKIMNIIRDYIKMHRTFYDGIMSDLGKDGQSRRRSDLSPKLMSRIAQSIVLFLGLLESIDPTDADYIDIVKFVTTLLKG
ncbi:MAG: TetR/AcrR family transcriptional regulator [Spirochaetes bacterium]|nr:TetR/AcrR family transcriptional regulator [Spirochaetota bacterium]